MSLALGLGKTIVDGGISWTFSPAYPKKPPPFGSVQELLNGTQTEFWAVNMGKPPAYDPVSETEYLVRCDLADAEADEALRFWLRPSIPIATGLFRDRRRAGRGSSTSLRCWCRSSFR